MNQRLINQLETYGVDFDKAAEVYEVADRTSGAAIGESYHSYLTGVLTAYNESKKAEINQLAESFYKSSLESMKAVEKTSDPVSQITKEEVLQLSPTEATRLRNKIGAEAYNSIMEGKKAPIKQLLEEPSDSHETYEQYRGANLQEIPVSTAMLIKKEAPSIYATLSK
ncbi:hypothetical protein P7E30_18820 [Enterococcus gallinarum]|uniref:Uncharacterized protein n=1 Tax=Enterococcus gallinarum TaxID=1353 RepID=A0AAE4HTR3_ENTGA|nr:hypothetical protein [Enterococcus gallinarum]MDT2692214.1 hypothetical protein [Enterococcus gallinarum]